MKREILCPGCCKEFLTLVEGMAAGDVYTTSTKFAGEWVQVHHGRVMRSCICDHCGVDLEAGVKCVGVSIFTKDRPFYPWEHLYINRETETERR